MKYCTRSVWRVGTGTNQSQPRLSPSFVLRLLGEDGIHHRNKQYPPHFCRDANGLSGDRIRWSATINGANILGFGGPPEGGCQSRVKVVSVFIAKYCALHVINGAGTVPTITVLRPAHPVKVGTYLGLEAKLKI